jgi:hypothetical protein
VLTRVTTCSKTNICIVGHFCNYDDVSDGVCELCPNGDSETSCLVAGLSPAGEQDCANQCVDTTRHIRRLSSSDDISGGFYKCTCPSGYQETTAHTTHDSGSPHQCLATPAPTAVPTAAPTQVCTEQYINYYLRTAPPPPTHSRLS